MKHITKSKKIVLIHPVISEDIEYHWMPTSLLAVSSKLDRLGYSIKIVDERIVEKDAFDNEILEAAKDALLVGFSVMTGYQIHGAARTSKTIKSVYPNLPIIWGGDHPTVAPEQVMELPFVDMAAVGQGEETLYEIVSGLQQDKCLSGIKGLYFKENGSVLSNPRRKFHEIDPYYPLPYHLLNVRAYVNPKTEAFNYYTSSGCAPGKCRFCNTGSSYAGWRAVRPEKVVNQIKLLVDEYGLRNCMFQDSNFFVNEKRVREICLLLLKENIHINWNASGRADQLSRYSNETFDLMSRSGCVCIFIGVESGSQRMLDLMAKMENVECMIDLAKKIRRLSIDLHISLIFALPGETVEDLKTTVEYLNKLKAINTRIKEQRCFFTPYPGTSLYEEVVNLGYRPPKDVYGWINVEQPSSFVDLPWMDNSIKEQYRKVFEENFKVQTRTEFN